MNNYTYSNIVLHFKQVTLYVFIACSISIVTFLGLYALNLVPHTLFAVHASLYDGMTEADYAAFFHTDTHLEEPVRIVISKIDVDAPISNPQTVDSKVLDAKLTEGAVHYPGSGFLGSGNMFLFGHSTGYRVVHNQAYKTFNHLDQLTQGDVIKVYSTDYIYSYIVRDVKLVDKNEAFITFSNDVNMMTISTCDSFGAKSQRFVAQADYQGRERR